MAELSYANKKLLKIKYRKGDYYLSYADLNSKDGQDHLRRVHDTKDFSIVCLCKGANNPIPMYVSKYINRYSLKTIQKKTGTRYIHNMNCPRYNEDSSDSGSFKGKPLEISVEIIEENGMKYPVFNSRDYIVKETSEIISKGHTGKTSYKHNRYTKLFAMGELLLSTAWSNYVHKNKQIPNESSILYTIYSDIYKRSLVDKHTHLSDIMFSPPYSKDIDNFDITNLVKNVCYSIYKKGESANSKGYNMYVLAKLQLPKDNDNKECIPNDVDNNGYVQINLAYPIRQGVILTFNAYIKQSTLERKLAEHTVLWADKYASAYLHYTNDKLYIEKISIIPVMQYKCFYVESSKEIQFSRMLIKNKKLFLKPCKSIKSKEWNGYEPDFLIYDNTTNDYTTVVEVFGFYGDKYEETTKKKINYYSELQKKGKIKFIYWKANKNEAMPTIE